MINMKRQRVVFFYVIGLLIFPPLVAQDQEALRREEQEDYYKKWLTQDVVYIITDEEQSVFKNLTTFEEKDQFIEQFWFRRDTELDSSINEFKEEHYRRIAYANERFESGKAGWRTDRGRIYIMHGPPAQIESTPMGGDYIRPVWEGGGKTRTYPFELWRYRHIDGAGSDVELEFVDRTFTGEYRLAVNHWEKDALMNTPQGGETEVELEGLAGKDTRMARLFGALPLWVDETPYRMGKDQFIDRLMRVVAVQRPPKIKYKDLEEIVKVNLTFNDLPFQIRQDYFKLNEDRVVVPITLEFENKYLNFKEENGIHTAKIALYGVITSITNRIVQEFEDDLQIAYKPEFLRQGLLERSLYQKVVALDKKMRYKLDLVVRDLNSGRASHIRHVIVPPRYKEQELAISSLVLSNYLRRVEVALDQDEMFMLGDIKVHPSPSKIFSAEGPLSLYLQVYNAATDQATLAPDLQISYKILREGELVAKQVDNRLESVQVASGWRVILVNHIPMNILGPGKYRVEIEVRDNIQDRFITTSEDFELRLPASVETG